MGYELNHLDRSQRRRVDGPLHVGAIDRCSLLILIVGLCAQIGSNGVLASDRERNVGLECIVQVEVQYDENLEFTNISRSLGEFLFRDERANREELGGPRFAWEKSHLLYFFLDKKCENRVDRIRSILLGYRMTRNAFDLVFKIDPASNPSDLLQQTLRLQERYRSSKFTRRQCIVEIDIVGGSDSKKWKSVGAESPYNFMLNYGKRHHSRLSLFAFSGGLDQIHLIFFDRCDRRVEMAREIMSAYMERYPIGPKFVVRNQSVEPGPDTIDVTHPRWLDTRESKDSRSTP